MANSENYFLEKLKSFIKLVVVLFIIIKFVLPVLERLLDDDGSTDGDSTVDSGDNAVDSGDKDKDKDKNDTSDGIVSRVSRWMYSGKWRKAKFSCPKRVLDDAENDLKQLEGVLRKNYFARAAPSWLSEKYYRMLTDDDRALVEFWEAVYKIIRDRNEDNVKFISDKFKRWGRKHNVKGTELVGMVISFVQYMDYMIPKDNLFEVLPPVNTVMRNEGDCDTRSVLLAMILEDLGFDAIVLYSEHYLHAVAAVDIGRGDYIKYRNKKYYIIETTAKGWKLGMMPPDTNNISYWSAIDL